MTGQLRGDEAPPACMRGATMDQNDAGLGRIAPTKIVNRTTFDVDDAVLIRRRERLAKPAWCPVPACRPTKGCDAGAARRGVRSGGQRCGARAGGDVLGSAVRSIV